jgi:hypothetical protein
MSGALESGREKCPIRAFSASNCHNAGDSYNDRRAVGSIWIIAHDDTRKFDACDVQIVTELGRLASSAHAVLTSLGYVQQAGGPDAGRPSPA